MCGLHLLLSTLPSIPLPAKTLKRPSLPGLVLKLGRRHRALTDLVTVRKLAQPTAVRYRQPPRYKAQLYRPCRLPHRTVHRSTSRMQADSMSVTCITATCTLRRPSLFLNVSHAFLSLYSPTNLEQIQISSPMSPMVPLTIQASDSTLRRAHPRRGRPFRRTLSVG